MTEGDQLPENPFISSRTNALNRTNAQAFGFWPVTLGSPFHARASKFSRAIQTLFALIVFAFLASVAEAKTITIVTADRLEFRNVTTPSGEKEEYITIQGSPAIVRIDDDELEASRIEYNKTKRTLTVIGEGVFRGKTDTIAGRDFVVDLDKDTLDGGDVIIVTSEIDVIGVDAQRVPGQLEVSQGYFSPCGRCGRTPNDYGFRAQYLTLYPGDRLIARNVTVLIADEPVMFLPIVVLFLGDPARQPRFSFTTGGDNGGDGTQISADLPFVTGDFGVGFAFLRYFQYRQPAFGFGTDYTAYNLFGGVNRTRLYLLALPPADARATKDGTVVPPSVTGALLAYTLSTDGRIELTPGADSEDALPPVSFSARVSRRDSNINDPTLTSPSNSGGFGGLGSDCQPTVSSFGSDRRTDIAVRFCMRNQNFSGDLELNGFIDNHDTSGFTDDQRLRSLPSGIIQYLPELRVTLLGGTLPKLGGFSVNSFGVKIGRIAAPVNTFNRSATVLANGSPYISALRLETSYALGFTTEIWSGGTFTASNSFIGRYYTTRNPVTPGTQQQGQNGNGELERNVNLSIGLGFRQALFDNKLSFGFGYQFNLSEGESPFSFDSVPRRPASEALNFDLTARPLGWLSLSLRENYDARRICDALCIRFDGGRPVKLDPLDFSVTINPVPLNASFNYRYDLWRNQAVSWSARVGNAVTSGTSFSVSTGYRFGAIVDFLSTNSLLARYDDLNATLGYRTPDSSFSASLGFTENVNLGQIRRWTLSSTLLIGPREDLLSLNLNQTLTPPQYDIQPTQNFFRLNSSLNASYAGLNANLQTNFDFRDWAYSTQTPLPPNNLSLTVSSSSRDINSNQNVSWSVNLSSLLAFGPLALYQPRLSGSLSWSQPNASFNLSAVYNLPGVGQDFELSNLQLSSIDLDVAPGVGLKGSLSYARSRSGTTMTETFGLTPLGVTFALAGADQPKPEVYFSVQLNTTLTLTYVDGVRTSPDPLLQIRPRFTLIFDRCCYAVQVVFDAGGTNGSSVAISFILPINGSNNTQDILTANPLDGLRFPLLPFLPPLK
jgi:hypothetical protein